MRIWCASCIHFIKTHLKRIWNAYLETARLRFIKSIIYALIERIWKAFKYAHSFRILDAHSVRIVGAHCISIYFLYIYFHDMKKEFLQNVPLIMLNNFYRDKHCLKIKRGLSVEVTEKRQNDSQRWRHTSKTRYGTRKSIILKCASDPVKQLHP